MNQREKLVNKFEVFLREVFAKLVHSEADFKKAKELQGLFDLNFKNKK